MEKSQFNQMIHLFNENTDIAFERGLQILKTKEIPIFAHHNVFLDILRSKQWKLKHILLIYRVLIEFYHFRMERIDIQNIFEHYSYAPRLCSL
jgi:hypothetical protein